MRKGLFFLLLVFTVTGAFHVRQALKPKPITVATVHDEIVRKIPLGATVDDVKSWLVGKKWEFSYFGARDRDFADIVIDSGHRPADLKAAIVAATPRKQEFLRTSYISIAFYFDRDYKLIGFSVSELGTSL